MIFSSKTTLKRLIELDFLRAIAIFLILAHHSGASTLLLKMGWIGVDLFFVLSGFLISGLLFNEYQQSGKIRPGYFLARRAMKIYPLFYAVLLAQVVYLLYKGIQFTKIQILAEIFFFQNYTEGVLGVSWSLAIEEHFYLLATFGLFFAAKSQKIEKSLIVSFCCIAICLICLFFRIYTSWGRGHVSLFVNDFPTHLRMDSLSFGVLISYYYHFYYEEFKNIFLKYWRIALLVSLVFFCPVFIWERHTAIVITVGYSFLYLGFGLILSLMIVFSSCIAIFLKKNRLQTFYFFIARIGRYSYAIYLCHFFLGAGVVNAVKKEISASLPHWIYISIYFLVTISVGILLTKIIEKPFLKIRDRYIPSAVNAL